MNDIGTPRWRNRCATHEGYGTREITMRSGGRSIRVRCRGEEEITVHYFLPRFQSFGRLQHVMVPEGEEDFLKS
jgi:hypothetical protein